jgi:hypothetical protein
MLNCGSVAAVVKRRVSVPAVAKGRRGTLLLLTSAKG